MNNNTTPRNAGKVFTVNEISALFVLLGTTSVTKIAKSLGRTEKAIRRKAEKLGLSVAVGQ